MLAFRTCDEDLKVSEVVCFKCANAAQWMRNCCENNSMHRVHLSTFVITPSSSRKYSSR